jgi:hypothetical protein
LGAATPFGIHAGSEITNSGVTTVTGELGLSPGSTLSGTPITLIGTQHIADAVAAQAHTDATSAYWDITSRSNTGLVVSDLAGQTLSPDAYFPVTPGGFSNTGTVTLDAGGDPDAVFIFVSDSTITTDALSAVVLTGGADWCNVFWVAPGDVSLGEESTFFGTVIAEGDIILHTPSVTFSAVVTGRVISLSGIIDIEVGSITNDQTCVAREPWIGNKNTANPVSPTAFFPWLFYVPDSCSSAPFYTADWEERARSALDAYTAYAVSQELDAGTFSGSPSLRSTATDISGLTAVDVVTAISQLIAARVQAGLGGVATIHIPQWLIPAAEADSILELTGTGLTTSEGFARVSPGPGYSGYSPTGVAPGLNEGWIYITGPVETEVGDIFVHPSQTEQQHRMNNVEVYAERAAIFRFDPCGVYAVLASTCGCSASSDLDAGPEI